MQWIQDPIQSNVDNLNNVRSEVSRHFRNKKKAYLRAKIEELETNSKTQNIWDLYRGINDFKKGYQPRCNTVKVYVLYVASVDCYAQGATPVFNL